MERLWRWLFRPRRTFVTEYDLRLLERSFGIRYDNDSGAWSKLGVAVETAGEADDERYEYGPLWMALCAHRISSPESGVISISMHEVMKTCADLNAGKEFV